MANFQVGPEELPGIAVVGMAGRFPQAADIDEFWRHLCAGRECLSRFGTAELRTAGVPEALLSDRRYVPVNGLLADIDLFDASFFRMNPREASLTDPQHRLFLELAWQALEHSGHDPANYRGTIGVYAGCGLSSYLLHNLWSNRTDLADIGELRARMANSQEYLATRVSYKLDLTGPSVNINTACSTSLVALHMACDALLNFQCDMALGGGISVQVPQVKGYLYEEGGILSPDGHCRAFDAAAQGTVSGNGGAVVVLKRLADALADGDTVYAVIRGSAINNDGADKAGYTAPSAGGQARVIAEAQAMADIDAASIGYVEAHGTGTPLGDPIELAALTQVFRKQTARTQFCAIGSVKTNVGHLDEAAGVAGLIKAVLSLYHRQIPPSLHFNNPNPEIDFAASPFYVNTVLRQWPTPTDETPRRAAVSSFGIGGTNAHVVLEEAPAHADLPSPRETHLLVLSAHTRAGLETACLHLADHLQHHPEVSLADVAFTLAVGRRAFLERRAVVSGTHAEAIAQLRSGVSEACAVASTARQAVFLFPGQGAQHAGMGSELYRTESIFREAIDTCADILERRCGFDLRNVLFRTDGSSDATIAAQPTLFAVEYAVAVLLQTWGLKPQAMIGHSLGEYVAATLAGVFSLEDALALVAERGRLMQATAPGAMIAVPMSESECAPLLKLGLSIAAVNAPSSTVLSGPVEAVALAEAELTAGGATSIRLRTSHAFHSSTMEPILAAFHELVQKTTLRTPATPFISNVTGEWITAAQATDPDYWVSHVRRPVRFSAGVTRLLEFPDASWIEVGPGRALAALVERRPYAPRVCQTLPSAGSKSDRSTTILSALGRLWSTGMSVDWQGFFKGEQRRRTPLPTYPFERQRYWIDAPAQTSTPQPAIAPAEKTIDSSPVESWFYAPRWTQSTTTRDNRLTGGVWMVFGGEPGLTEELTGRLRNVGARVTVVRQGDTYERLQSEQFVLPLDDPAAHAQLWRDMDELTRSESNLLLFSPGHGTSPDAGVLSLLALVQGIGSSTAARRLVVVTSNAQAVLGNEASCPTDGMVCGALGVIAQEYPNLECCVIDLDSCDREPQAASNILAGLSQGGVSLALRQGSVWEQRIEPAQLAETETPRTRQHGTYMITGGLGSMGLAFAEHLAQTARARLVLVSRTGLAGERQKARSRFPLLSDFEAIEGIERAAQTNTGIIPLSLKPGLEPLLNRFCSSLVWEFVSRGFPSLQPGSRCSVEQLATRLELLPKFRRFLEAFLRLLIENRIVKRYGDEIEILNHNVASLDALVTDLALRFPSFVPLADLISHCARNYPDALSGRIPAVSVLYADGTSDWLDKAMSGIPNHAWDAAYLRTATDVVARLIADQSQPVRILEAGGGTGNLTHLLAGVIASGKVEYHFTDIGPTFVARAKQEADQRGLQHMRFGRLDISQSPEPQGFPAGSYDLAVAYNVVHATPHIVQTGRHLRSLLTPGGALILVETVNPPCWVDLIWGLTDGWWAFRDYSRRQSSPLLPLEEWEKVLAEAGFSRTTSYPRQTRARQQLDAGLIVAETTDLDVVDERDVRIRERISGMEATGAEVCVIAADIANAGDVWRVVETAERRFGPINGVIHTAGVLGQTLIHQQTQAEVRRVLAPKVDGTLHLASALGNRPLDFFILCSSMSSIEPIPGQFAYSAANAFLDSFAQFRTARYPGLTVSIDWGFWQELGMIEAANVSEVAKRSTRDEIKSKGWSNRGVEIFTRILRSQAPAQLLVSPRPPASRAANVAGAGERVDHPVLHSWTMENPGCAVFSGTISESNTWLVSEHRVGGQAVLPATAYLDLAVTAFWHRHGRCAVELTDVCFLTPMAFTEREARQVRLILEENSGSYGFRVVSQLSQQTWQEHARGEIQACPADMVRERIDIEKIEQRLVAEPNGCSQIPAGFWERVKSFGPHWRNVADAVFGSSEGVARFELAPELTSDLSQFALHPALLDTATGFMVFRIAFDPFVPFSFRRVHVFDRLPASCASTFRFVPDSPVFAGSVVDALGNEIVRVEEYTLRRSVGGTAATRSVQVPAENVTLEIGSPGELQTLVYRPSPRIQPRAGEVEIEVRAAGLNFIEVLYALGMLPQFAGRRATFGQECAGVVARTGDGVEGLKPGDEVIAYGSACFSLYTTLRAETVAPKPAGLSFEAAAGLPAAFATSWYSLMHLARLQPGNRVLIHAAAGGVGLAAVRIAQWRGAEIFATAGSPEKRRFLSELGIARVMDSRSLDFADEVRRITNGEGIDVVLNSLSGDFITKSLELLRRHGRFIELGKRDIFRNTALGMGAFANSIAFFAVDMGTDVPGFAAMWREIMEHFRSQSFGPVPYQTFPATSVQEAFEHMAQARHIGKVILSFDDAESVRAAASAPPAGLRWTDIMRRGGGVALLNSWGPAPSLASVPRAAELTGHEQPPLPTAFRAPESATERAIAGLWEKLLGVTPIGAEDDFFALKGDSLLAAQVMSQLQRLFAVKLPLSLIFDFPKVRGLAIQIDSSLSPRKSFEEPVGEAPAAQVGEPASIAAERILPAPLDTDYPLTHAQKRLWILAQNPSASVAYNMSYSLSLNGALDIAALRQAFGLVAGRHEILRTAFITKGGEPRQQVRSAPPFSLPVLDLRGESDGATTVDREIGVEALTAFALDQPPLLRGRLLHVAEHKHVLLVTLHHIIADGLSLNVLMHELHVCYAALCANMAPALPPLTIHYKDFAVWQQQQLASKAMQAHRSYWLEKLGGELPVLALPTDRPRPSLQQFSGGQVVLRLPPPAQAALYQRCREQGVTLFTLLVAALKVLLHQATGQAEILIGSPVAGREQGELAGQIGYYLNNVVLRDTIRRSEPFTVLLQRVRNTVTEAIAHQAYPFDLLIEELAVTPELGHSPLFDVQLNLMPREVPALHLGDLAVAGSVTNSQTAIFDLNFMFSDGALGLAVEISYGTALFDAATIEQMGDRLLRLLTAIGEQPEATVRMLCALLDEGASAAEKAEFLATSLNLDEEF